MDQSTSVSSKTTLFQFPIGSKSSKGPNQVNRTVVIRYFLDRAGYNHDHSSARIWTNAPSLCKASDIRRFLFDNGILEGFTLADEESLSTVDTPNKQVSDTDKVLVEVRLDEYQTYMSLEACGDSICFDFSHASPQQPGTLTLRLTDLTAIGRNETLQEAKVEKAASPTSPTTTCNMTPAGLFAFSMIVGLEATEVTGALLGNGFASEGFQLIYGPYGFFVGGLLQLLVGMWEVTRNNIFGATAFSAFGCFWLGNGTKIMLTSYFRDFINEEYLVSDPWGNCMRNLYILFIALILLKQTLNMTKVTTTLVSILVLSQILLTMSGFYRTVQIIQAVVGWCMSGFAMYAFMAEFTNEVYDREVFKLHPWNKHSADQVAGAVGRPQSLQSAAAVLRTGSSSAAAQTQKNIDASAKFVSVRAATPSAKGSFFAKTDDVVADRV